MSKKLICFSCLNKEFNKVDKKIPDGSTSTCKRDKCDYCGKNYVSVLSTAKFDFLIQNNNENQGWPGIS